MAAKPEKENSRSCKIWRKCCRNRRARKSPRILAARIGVSEAGLYRTLPARRRCSEMIEFIEQTLFA